MKRLAQVAGTSHCFVQDLTETQACELSETILKIHRDLKEHPRCRRCGKLLEESQRNDLRCPDCVAALLAIEEEIRKEQEKKERKEKKHAKAVEV
jgi:tRNA(Ile2) C34 agmatinyltransferase TiaS